MQGGICTGLLAQPISPADLRHRSPASRSTDPQAHALNTLLFQATEFGDGLLHSINVTLGIPDAGERVIKLRVSQVAVDSLAVGLWGSSIFLNSAFLLARWWQNSPGLSW